MANICKTKADFSVCTKNQLLEYAKEYEIKGRHDMRKDDLVSAVYAAYLNQCADNKSGDVDKAIDENAKSKNIKPVEQVEVISQGNQPSGKTRWDYINSVNVGQLIAFEVSEVKAISAKVVNVSRNKNREVVFVICETKIGTRYKIPSSKILWVKTQAKWSREVAKKLMYYKK